MSGWKKTMIASAGGGGYWAGEFDPAGSIQSIAKQALDYDSQGQVGFKITNWYDSNGNGELVGVIDATGSLLWQMQFCPASIENQTKAVFFDSSDRLYAVIQSNAYSDANIIRFSTSGVKNTNDYKIDSWGAKADQAYEMDENDVLATTSQDSNGLLQLRIDLSGNNFDYPSGSSYNDPQFRRRQTADGTVRYPFGQKFQGSYLYTWMRKGAGPYPDVQLEAISRTINSTTSIGSYESREIDGYSYIGNDCNANTLDVDSSGYPYVCYKGSHDGSYIDSVVGLKLNPYASSFSNNWGRYFRYSTRDKLRGGTACLDGSGNVHFGMYITGNTTSTSGIYIETFNTSGTFQRELQITIATGAGGSSDLYYMNFTMKIDSNDDMYITFACFNGSKWTPYYLKLPADYSSIAGTHGDFVITYRTSSTFTTAAYSPTNYNGYSYANNVGNAGRFVKNYDSNNDYSGAASFSATSI